MIASHAVQSPWLTAPSLFALCSIRLCISCCAVSLAHGAIGVLRAFDAFASCRGAVSLAHNAIGVHYYCLGWELNDRICRTKAQKAAKRTLAKKQKMEQEQKATIARIALCRLHAIRCK